jgi:hypothetical protein
MDLIPSPQQLFLGFWVRASRSNLGKLPGKI